MHGMEYSLKKNSINFIIDVRFLHHCKRLQLKNQLFKNQSVKSFHFIVILQYNLLLLN